MDKQKTEILFNEEVFNKMNQILKSEKIDIDEFVNTAIKHYIDEMGNIEQTTSKKYKLGDIISFSLSTGESCRAIAVKEESDGMLFIFKDCLRTTKSHLDSLSEYNYNTSTIRQYLNFIIPTIPEEIHSEMLPVYNTDLLRLPREIEIFGENEYGIEDLDFEQFECMKELDNRIARVNNISFDYWLMDDEYEIYNCCCVCNEHGEASCAAVTLSLGIRPVFKLKKFM